MPRVDYSKEHYCHHCAIKLALDIFRCPDCKQKARTKPHNKSTYYRRHKQENIHLPDFRVKMRKLRVKRIMMGLKPNIPLPEV